MQALIGIILQAGKSAVELTLYVLLPVMVVMMAVMKVLEEKGALAFVASKLAPVLKPFGVPGIGILAVLQLLFVNFAAPAATLKSMARTKEGISQRQIAATLAMILAMSQANAVFPLLDLGLSLAATLLTSFVGGFAAAAITYYVFARPKDSDEVLQMSVALVEQKNRSVRVLKALQTGGLGGIVLCIRSFPILLLALCLVKSLELLGAIASLERGLSPIAQSVGLPGIAVLPIATKYLAGGTAMLEIVRNLVKAGSLSTADLNRIAGLMINPFDVVGVSFLFSAAGPRVREIAWRVMAGAAVGILLRGVLHLLLF